MEEIVSIDRERCKKDGQCVADCPGKLLVPDEDGYPRPIEGSDEFCIDCGHCVAVCAEGALDHRYMRATGCPSPKQALTVSADQAAQLLVSRRSVRQYRREPVEREKILKLLEIASHAPSGHNRQPARWLVVTDRAEVHGMAGLVAEWMVSVMEGDPALAALLHLDRVVAAWREGQDRILRDAPHLIVGYAPKDERTATAAIITAIAYLELAAPPLGLGTCWAGYFTGACQSYEPLKEAVGLPEGHEVYGAVMIGYPRVRYHRIPRRKPVDVVWR